MINPADSRIVNSMIEKASRLIEICAKNTREQIAENYVLSDSLQYEFEKLYEDSTRLSFEFRMSHDWLHIDDLRAIRNRVAHNYESVSLSILFDTVEKDIPKLKDLLEKVIEEGK